VHRYAEDVRLLRDLGVSAYRFSISWPRVLSEASGKLDRTGLDFYDRLVDDLLAAGIDPWVTLYHWDLPSRWQSAFGGWASRQIVEPFVEYTTPCMRRCDRARIDDERAGVLAWSATQR
jgi:beta-glucosidase